MALVLKDRVKETSTTAGTGTITLAGAVAGFQSFAAVGNGNSTYYAIVDPATGAWEVGIGTYTSSGTTLSRTTVLSSSNSGSLVSFAANSKDVFVTYPSERAVWLDSAGNVLVQYEFNTINATTANITTANLTSGTISTTPTNNTDIVNKQYADAIASGIHFHEAVDLATTAALPANTYNNGTSGVGATLTANANGALSVDSTLTVVGNRILVKNEVTQANNGVYTVTQVGSAGTPYILTRATDFDTAGTGVDQIDEGDFFLVTSGTVNANTAWVQQTAPPITIGTTAIVFQQFSAPITYTAGTGLSESPSYTFNIANTGTAGTYGSASAVPVFVTNAQGQVTSVTNTNIAINGSAVSGNISGSAGSVANALTLGTYLTGTSYNGSAAVTATVDATSANTASKVVARDVSGNFSAGTITAALSGNATTATTATNVAGGAANQIVYNTSAGTTNFAAAPSASGQLLGWNGSAYAWVSPVPTTSGGTGLTSFTSGGVVYASSTSALATGSALNFDGTNLSVGGSNSQQKLNIVVPVFTSNASGGMRIGNSGNNYYVDQLITTDASANPAWETKFATHTLSKYFYAGGVNAWAWYANNSEQMRLTTTGLGIGNSSPPVKLVVGAATGAQNTARIYGDNNTNNAPVLSLYRTAARESVIAQTTSGMVFANTGGLANYQDATIDAAANLTLTTAGNLGIGTTSPASRLHASSATETILTLQSTATSTGTTRLRLYSATATTAYDWYIQGDAASGTLRFYNAQGSAEVARITQAGAWSFGSSGTATGTSGQILTSNGSGAAPSWQTSTAAAKGFAVGMSLVFGR